MMRGLVSRGALVGLAASWLAAPLAAGALVVVTVQPAATSVAVGSSVTVDLVADFTAGPEDDGVLAWGLDLSFDPARVGVVGSPTLGPGWLSFSTPDGDSLGGVALAGVTGTGLLLASVTLEGLSSGTTALGLAVTGGDPNEGFALDPEGFATDVTFHGATLSVVPEPSALPLLAWIAFAARRFGTGPLQRVARARRRRRLESSSSTIGASPSA